MKVFYSCVILFLLSFNLYSQKEVNIWYFGGFAGLNFNAGSPPTALTNGKINTVEGCATICTKTGRIMFYTDGVTVWDSTHNAMSNGTGLKGNKLATQSGLIIPRPDSSHLFYVFTVDDDAGTDGVCYSEINMNLNNGKGAIISGKKNITLLTPTCEKITAVKHANGRDYWMITHKFNTDTVFSFLITPSGVNHTPVKSATGVKLTGNIANAVGCLKVSPDGKKIALANFYKDTVVYGDFNTNTGRMSNPWKFKFNLPYGIEFSPKSQFLYVTEYIGKKVVQYNVRNSSLSSFLSSKITVDSNYGGTLGSVQLGPDGKIYVACNGTYIHVLHAPDSSGFSVRPQKNYVYLNGKNCLLGLPAFIQSYIERKRFNIVRNCQHDTTKFELTDLSYLDSLIWDFGDPLSGSLNKSKNKTGVYHIYNTVGYKTIKLITYYNSYIDTVKQTIFVKNSKPFIGNDSLFCNSFSLKLKPTKLYKSYKWNNNTTADTLRITQKGIYILNIIDSTGCKNADTIEISNPIVKPMFYLSDTAKCFNYNKIKVVDTSKYIDDAFLTRIWKFGDSTFKSDSIEDKIFSKSDTYFITLKLKSNAGCYDSITKKVTVHPNSNLKFSINDSDQCFIGHDYKFTNQSTIKTGTITSYLWNFGDGNSSSDTNIASKQYNIDSIYTIRLFSNSDKNCKDTIKREIFLHPNSQLAIQTIKDTFCFNEQPIVFNNKLSISKGIIDTSTLYFGDNQKSGLRGPINKSYSNSGTFILKVITKSDKGCIDSLSKTIIIHPSPRTDFIILDSTQCFKGHDFAFLDSSKNNGGNIISYFWNLGDGNTSSDKNIYTKKYSKDTIVNIEHIVFSDKNCSDTLIKPISIYPNSKLNFSISNDTQCQRYNRFDFTNNSTISKGSIIQNKWKISDGDSFNSLNVQNKHFISEDSFSIMLITTSDMECLDTLIKNVKVHPNAQLDFEISRDTQCFKYNLFSFINNSNISLGNLNFKWDFDDGTTDTLIDITHKSFSVFGEYSIKLSSNSEKHCKDTIVKKIIILASPVASFDIDDNKQCFRDNLFNISNRSSINNGWINNHTWLFNNDTFSKSKDLLNVSMSSEDTFNITLHVTSELGCNDTAYGELITFAQPYASFIIPNDTQCWQKNYFNIINSTTIKEGRLLSNWDFGDGTGDTSFTPGTKKYSNKSASYMVKYKVQTLNNCIDSMSRFITLLERPIADFEIDDSIQCYKDHIFNFANNTSFSAPHTVSHFWNYGNNDTSIGLLPKSSTYGSTGYKNVELITYSYLTNCYDTIVKSLLVAPHSLPNFTVANDSLCIKSNVFSFTNSSTLEFGKMQYHWKFGDNTSSSIANPVKSYISGTNYTGRSYNVWLRVTSDRNCIDSTMFPITLLPHAKTNFTINDSIQCLNNHGFDITNTSTIQYGSYNSKWYFNDNDSFLLKDITSMKFEKDGFHTFYLVTSSNANCLDTLNGRIFLEKDKNISIVNSDLDSQCLRNNKFTLNVTKANSTITIDNYEWSYGDNVKSNNPIGNHSYSKDTNFSPMVATVSSNGCRDTAYYDIVTMPHPKNSFEANSPCHPDSVIFKQTSTIKTGVLQEYQWSFGDNSFSTVKNPAHWYQVPGSYNIRLITKSDFGCKDTLNSPNSINVRTKPLADFSFTRLDDKAFNIAQVQFINLSKNNISSNFWDFGDGNTNTEFDPLHEFEDSFNRIVTLITTNNEGCTDTFSKKTGTLIMDFRFHLPNSFSPDNNLINDIFVPVATPYVRQYTMEIFNRWGQMVFKTNDITQGWDGTYSGNPCEQGVYIVRIYLVPMRGRIQSHEKTITLLR